MGRHIYGRPRSARNQVRKIIGSSENLFKSPLFIKYINFKRKDYEKWKLYRTDVRS